MTEPILTSQELKPLLSLVFRKRFRILGLFLLVTIAFYAFLRIVKFASYEAASVVMVKIPLIEYDVRVDPNPQVAPAYLDLAMSGGLLADTHALMRQMRRLAEPIAQELGIEEHVTTSLRKGWLPKLLDMPDLAERLSKAASTLPDEWQRDIFSDPEAFLALFEIHPKDVDSVDLFKMKQAFNVRSGIAAQTNVSILNEPFLTMKVSWSSPGAAALWANLWGHVFVDRSNDLTVETGVSTEKSLLTEAEKIESQLDRLKTERAAKRGSAEYQKLLKAQALENALYGGRTKIDMFGYVEFHASFSNEAGLHGKLSEVKLELAKAVGEASALQKQMEESKDTPDPEASELRRQSNLAELKTRQVAAQVAETERQIAAMSGEAQRLREEVADFESDLQRTEFEIEQGTRIFSEKVTTTTVSRSRLKSGYQIPPMVFVERAVPDKHPAGPKKSILSLAVGALVTLVYLCWIIYQGYLVPTFHIPGKSAA